MLNRLRENRARIDQELQGVEGRRYFSPIFYAQYSLIPQLMQRYLRGKIIDLGCGTMPFRACVTDAVTVYHGLDISAKSPALSLIGDVQNLSMLKDASYDGAICLEVLEHVPEPAVALTEIARILKPGGTLLVSVPHLSRLHDLPHDYYRFTHIGLRYLLEKHGFTVVQLQPKGGIFTFIGHQLSTVLITATWSMPVLKPLVWQVNKWLLTLGCYFLDKITGKAGTFAAGYVAIATKRVEEVNDDGETRLSS